MKKITAVVLTVIMLMSLCGMQSSAFTIKLPTVTELKILDDEPISMKGLDYSAKARQEYIDYLEEWYDLDIEDMGYLYEEINKFYLGNFDVELTLSDGSVVTMNVDETYEIDRYTEITVYAYVLYDDYLELKESGADTVEITLDCSVYSYVSSFSKDSTFTVECDVVDCIIKSFKPTSTINYDLYEDSDALDLEGKKFSVTYADGTKETLTAKYDIEEELYILGDDYIYLWFNEDDTVEIQYIDEIYTHAVTCDNESPYESIEITDYAFNEEEGILTSISYVITDNKGKEKSFTVDTSSVLADADLNFIWQELAVFDSYAVTLYSEDAYDDESEEIVGCELYLGMGYLESEPVMLDYIEEDSRTLLEKIEDVIAAILGVFFLLFFPDEVM